MPDTVTMPKLGFDMAEGTLVRWVKVEGESVVKGNVLAEIETDKATVEVESNFSGVVLRHLVEQGSIVPVGTAIAIIGQPGETLDATPAPVQPGGAKKPPATTPTTNEIQADKETQEQLADIEPSADRRIKASPLARKVAEEMGINLRQVKGSGTGGRIVRKDVESAEIQVPPSAVKPEEKSVAPVSLSISEPAKKTPEKPAVLLSVWSTTGAAVEDQMVAVDRLRAAIGRRLVEAKQQVPHFYITHEYDMEAVLKLRSDLNGLLPDEQKLTVNDFLVKAVALALRQFPNINASLESTTIRRHGRVNVGVAVAVPGGLLTVVCKDADQKPLRVISSEVKEMVARARAGKVRPEDIEGSTFSISNLGMFDVEHFVAIINPPETAILAIGSARQVPVVINGEIKVGTRMLATISADHRVTDGAEAAQFLQALETYIEKPMYLVL
jgi:pyruvate dehydrogenase E2 component (dihydrolipoamide acetyltransferase)